MNNLVKKLPAFKFSYWLLRIPLSIVFIQQGLSKFPVKLEDAQAYAKKKGLVVSVSHVNETLFRPKSYTDNFTKKIR